jgi:hypothetical protein
MITEEQYLIALDVVEKYHKQLEVVSTKSGHRPKPSHAALFNGAKIEG